MSQLNPCFPGKRALCRAVEPPDGQKLKRKLTWRRKSSADRKRRKGRELRNGIPKDSDALMPDQSDIELSDVKVEVRVAGPGAIMAAGRKEK